LAALFAKKNEAIQEMIKMLMAYDLRIAQSARIHQIEEERQESKKGNAPAASLEAAISKLITFLNSLLFVIQ
jgi:hypothetical protein